MNNDLSKALIERLRGWTTSFELEWCDEAADEIEALERELATAKGLLREGRYAELCVEFDEVTKQRDELLAALEEFVRNPAGDYTEEVAIELIARVKESK